MSTAVAGVAYSVAALWSVAAVAATITNKSVQNIVVLVAWAIALALPIARPPSALASWLLCVGPPAAAALTWRYESALGAGPLAAGLAALAALKNDTIVLGIGIGAISLALGVLIEYNNPLSALAPATGVARRKTPVNTTDASSTTVAGSMAVLPTLRKFI
jgi:4-amino-4-deoxy-L-arabinose transferase-like glycosyltransferase